jgi:putative ABC transport system permease protein
VLNEYAARFRAVPGVTAVGATNILPLDGGSENVFTFSIEGREPFAPGTDPSATHYFVSDGYFEAMGMQVLRGRPFTAQDRADSPPVAVVSKGFADRFFPGEDPVGRHIAIDSAPGSLREIVGIVRDVRHLALDDARELQLYEPISQRPVSTASFVIRTAGPDAGLGAALREIVREVDPEQPVIRLTPISSLVSETLARPRFGMTLFGVFAALALVLAAIGIYGVMAYNVSQRTAEFGVRMARGAQPADVLRLVLSGGARLVLLGIAAGTVVTLAAGRLIESMLFRTSAHDPLILASIALVLSAVAALACLIPARRATKVDPMTALRTE